jgi:hypothetical protein
MLRVSLLPEGDNPLAVNHLFGSEARSLTRYTVDFRIRSDGSSKVEDGIE